ncbi:hypothetical protein CK203_112918 [Vitis vinifera]|uniref:Uncharacterized protein n=1 Tax=Vitis vinifera TaxID=29760 RepID=A0A438BNX8_VITVI|nr:hypothetical protein CK203_112918 [Vitis vinifera]
MVSLFIVKMVSIEGLRDYVWRFSATCPFDEMKLASMEESFTRAYNYASSEEDVKTLVPKVITTNLKSRQRRDMDPLLNVKMEDKEGLRNMTEPPFVPREKILEKQRFFQQVHKHTYLKGPMDKITSVAIPAALAAASVALIAQGIYNMAHGIGKKE